MIPVFRPGCAGGWGVRVLLPGLRHGASENREAPPEWATHLVRRVFGVFSCEFFPMQEDRSMTKTTPKNRRVQRQAPAAKVPEPKPERPPCLCGCGGTPKSPKGRYLPGHDAKHHSALKRAAKEAQA